MGHKGSRLSPEFSLRCIAYIIIIIIITATRMRELPVIGY